MELSRYYETLDIKPNTSDKDLKQAYRDLVKVWHPDRFLNDTRLQQKAQEKLKEINEAYEKICYYRKANQSADSSSSDSLKNKTTEVKRENKTKQKVFAPVLLRRANIGGADYITFSNDGSLILSKAEQILIHKVKDLKLVKQIKIESSIPSLVKLIVEPTWKFAILCDNYSFKVNNLKDNNNINLYSVPDFKLIKKFPAHEKMIPAYEKMITCLDISNDGKLLASCGWDKTVKVWEMPEGRLIGTFTHTTTVNSVSFSLDGKMLASSDICGNIGIWSIQDMGLFKTFSFGEGEWSIDKLKFSPDGSSLVFVKTQTYYGALDLFRNNPKYRHSMCLMQISDGNTFEFSHLGGVSSIHFSPRGKIMASGGDFGANIWRLSDGKEISNLGQNYLVDKVSSIKFSPDGELLAVSSTKYLDIWKMYR